MKWFNCLMMACLALLTGHSVAKNASSPPLKPASVATMIVMPQDLQQNPHITQDLQSRGINHATVYLNWCDVETTPGNFDFSAADAYFDKLTQDGLSLIMVLDMGGRPYFDAAGKLYVERSTVPEWVYEQVPDVRMKNFSGKTTPQPDFMNPALRELASRFIRETVGHMTVRYKDKILGFAIGLQEEHEIKYGQTGYEWRDYADAAQKAFRQQHGGAALPVINYTSDIALGLPKVEPLLHAQKQFREARLKEATCFYANTIRSQGGRAMGYFGELFTAHDAIYATSIAEQLADCLDIAVIDYNFFDGYALSGDARVLPMLANYMASVGYKNIMVGAYVEVWERVKKTDQLLPIISRSLSQALTLPNVIGYEIGGLQQQLTPHLAGTIDLEKLQALQVEPQPPKASHPPKERARIGLLASTSNYYVWHGDRSGGINIHREALLAAWELLGNHPQLDVFVIGEKNLLPGDTLLPTLDAIMAPHQAALPAWVKQQLKAFWQQGGTLIQDMRLGEFDENGKPVFDWMHEVFGIDNVTWMPRGGFFRLENGQTLRLKHAPKLYTGYAALTPRKGWCLLATDIKNKRHGIMVRGERTLVFGATPQLVEDDTRDAWHQLFVREIIHTIPCLAASSCKAIERKY